MKMAPGQRELKKVINFFESIEISNYLPSFVRGNVAPDSPLSIKESYFAKDSKE